MALQLNKKFQYRLLKKPRERRTADDLRTIDEIVKTVTFFRKLDSAIRLQCCSALRYQFLKAGRTIFEEGDIGTRFYIVLEGAVGVYVRDAAVDGIRSSANFEQRRKQREADRWREREKRYQQRLAEAMQVGSVVLRAKSVEPIGIEFEDSSTDSDSDIETDSESEDSGSRESEGENDMSSLGIRQSLLAHSVPQTSSCNLKQVVTLRDGQSFGEVALQTDQPRTATVKTCLPTHFAVLDREEYQEILARALEEENSLRLDLLSQTPFFAGHAREDLLKISHLFYQRSMRKNDIVYDEGSDSVQIYFVSEGEFAVLRRIGGPPPNIVRGRRSPAPSNGASNSSRTASKNTMISAFSAVRAAVAMGNAMPTKRKSFFCRSSRTPSQIATTLGLSLGKANAGRRSHRRSSISDAISAHPSQNHANYSPRGDRLTQWCIVSLVTRPQVFGLADYLSAARTHCERVICHTAIGQVYGILAKELLAHVSSEVRAKMLRAAHAHDLFAKQREIVLARLTPNFQKPLVPLASPQRSPSTLTRPSKLKFASPPTELHNVYTTEGRLETMAQALAKMPQLPSAVVCNSSLTEKSPSAQLQHAANDEQIKISGAWHVSAEQTCVVSSGGSRKHPTATKHQFFQVDEELPNMASPRAAASSVEHSPSKRVVEFSPEWKALLRKPSTEKSPSRCAAKPPPGLNVEVTQCDNTHFQELLAPNSTIPVGSKVTVTRELPRLLGRVVNPANVPAMIPAGKDIEEALGGPGIHEDELPCVATCSHPPKVEVVQLDTDTCASIASVLGDVFSFGCQQKVRVSPRMISPEAATLKNSDIYSLQNLGKL